MPMKIVAEITDRKISDKRARKAETAVFDMLSMLNFRRFAVGSDHLYKVYPSHKFSKHMEKAAKKRKRRR